MARTRSENYHEIQRGILAKAAALYSADGYARSSIADLAEACQLSRGALYHYFNSKEAILFAILDAHIQDMTDTIEIAIAAGSDPLDQFRRAIRAIVEVNAASPNEQRVLLNDLSFLGSDEQTALRRRGRQIVEIMADLLVRLDRDGKIVKRTKKVYTMMLFGIVNYTYTWFHPEGSVSPREFADMAVDLFLHGFGPAPTRKRGAAASALA